MTIAENSTIEFFGTQDDVTNASNSTIAANVYSVAGDIDDWTNDDDAPEAAAVLHYTSTSAPTAGGYVALYGILKNIDSTNDESVPTATDESAKLFGSFKIPNATSTYESIRIFLPNTVTSQVYEFYLLNKTDQTMLDTWTLKITPLTVGPHPA